MNNFIRKTTVLVELYAPSVLRLGMAAVILWFGLEQFLHNSQWTAYVPDYAIALSHMSAGTIVFLNAVFETVFGLALVFGWQTRFVALLLSLHLFDIMWTVGYGQIGARDFGLAVATLVVFMNGPDPLCVGQKKRTLPRESPALSDQGTSMTQPKPFVAPLQPLPQSRPPYQQPRRMV